MLHITGAIDESTFTAVAEYLNGRKDATIVVNSGGGDHLQSVAIWSMIKAHKGTVTTLAIGQVYSAAVLIFAAGDFRQAYADTWFMVHEDSGDFKGYSTSELKTEVLTMVRLEEHWAAMMQRATDTPAETWARLSLDTTYMPASEALALNLVHKLIKEKP